MVVAMPKKLLSPDFDKGFSVSLPHAYLCMTMHAQLAPAGMRRMWWSCHLLFIASVCVNEHVAHVALLGHICRDARPGARQ